MRTSIYSVDLTFRRKIVQRKMVFYGTYDKAVIHLGIDVDSEGTKNNTIIDFYLHIDSTLRRYIYSVRNNKITAWR